MINARDKIKTKLEAIGITEINDNLLDISLNEAETYIKNFCNISQIPDELCNTLINCAYGKYLLVLFSVGKIDDVINIETAISQISEGDVSVSFSSETSTKEQFLSFVSSLADPDISELLRFRKLVW